MCNHEIHSLQTCSTHAHGTCIPFPAVERRLRQQRRLATCGDEADRQLWLSHASSDLTALPCCCCCICHFACAQPATLRVSPVLLQATNRVPSSPHCFSLSLSPTCRLLGRRSPLVDGPSRPQHDTHSHTHARTDGSSRIWWRHDDSGQQRICSADESKRIRDVRHVHESRQRTA